MAPVDVALQLHRRGLVLARSRAVLLRLGARTSSARQIQDVADEVTYGWGMIPATVTVGDTTWPTALWPKNGTYVVPLKAWVRKAEGIDDGETIDVDLVVGAPELGDARPVLDEPDEIALAVAHEGLPLVGARRAERVVGVAEDHVRLDSIATTPLAQPGDGRLDVVDGEVVNRRRCSPVEQQPHAVEIEEHQPWRVVRRARCGAQQVGIEGRRPIEIVGVLGNLDESHDVATSIARTSVAIVCSD